MERWRGGESIDQKPLSALRSSEVVEAKASSKDKGPAVLRDVKLQLQDDKGKALLYQLNHFANAGSSGGNGGGRHIVW